METPRQRTTLLSAAAIGVVATMGLGFALWTETLNVDAFVNTGNLNVAFESAVAEDNEDGSQDDAQCSTTVNEGNLAVTLTNAYPGYSCDIATQITNSGTVDAVVTALLEDAASTPDSSGMITISRSSGNVGDAYPDGATAPGPNYTVAVNSAATETNVNEGDSYTIGASIDFANDTP